MKIKNTSLIAFIFLVVAAISFWLPLGEVKWHILTFCKIAGIIIFILGFLLNYDSIRTPAIISIIFIGIGGLLHLSGIWTINYESLMEKLSYETGNIVNTRFLLGRFSYYLTDYIPLLFFLFTLYKNDYFVKIKNLNFITLILLAVAFFSSIIGQIVWVQETLLNASRYYSSNSNSLFDTSWWFPRIYPIIQYAYLLEHISYFAGLLLITMSNFLNKGDFENDDKIELDHSEPISVKEWVITYLIVSLPIINVVMLFVWAFSKNIHLSKANWAKAALIWVVIIMALYFLFFVIIIGLML